MPVICSTQDICVAQHQSKHATLGRLLPVSALAALTALKLQHCRGLQRCTDLAPLAGLTALSALSLCGCTELQVGSLTACADACTYT